MTDQELQYRLAAERAALEEVAYTNRENFKRIVYKSGIQFVCIHKDHTNDVIDKLWPLLTQLSLPREPVLERMLREREALARASVYNICARRVADADEYAAEDFWLAADEAKAEALSATRPQPAGKEEA